MSSIAMMTSILILGSAAVDPQQKKDASGSPGQRSESRAGFHPGPYFNEQIREQWIENDVRVVFNVPPNYVANQPAQLVVYATPNGNTIEQTLGCELIDGLDWHFDIQHVAAQIRHVRKLRPNKNIVLACIEAEGLSWPAWRKKHTDAPAKARRVAAWLREAAGKVDRIVLTGHSGGGSFVFAYIDGGDTIPDDVERISFLDSNYSYTDASKHGDKLLTWLKGDSERRLTVIAYDDREITFNGKKVIGPGAGTFRATERMVARFQKDIPLVESKVGEFNAKRGLDDRVSFYVHPNPENKILHTALVGEMNGVSKVIIDDAMLGTPRNYTKFIQSAPAIPPRSLDAIGGKEFIQKIAKLPLAAREAAIAKEILTGNIPDFLRQFKTVAIQAKDHTVTFEVMPDYLAVGSDEDFVRIPMSALTGQTIADAFGCSLPTRKMVDHIHQQATVKLAPIPLTKDRDNVATFTQHHELIEKQRAGRTLGELVSGIKKDEVLTNRLGEKANRVAIYGWHKLDGNPIQPLSIVHVNWYVDYSHGVRLVKRNVLVDGKPRDIRHVLHDPVISDVISDEGPLQYPSY